MARKNAAFIERQLAEIVSILRSQTSSIWLLDLANEFERQTGAPIDYRTLLRRMDVLEQRGVVRSNRPRKNRRYWIGGAPDANPSPGPSETEPSVPLTREVATKRTLIQQPRLARPPVGYDPHFLDDYVPGTTWLLPKNVRDHLHARGQTPKEDQPAGTYARDIYERLIIDLSWGSSRLEGNKYTRINTEELLTAGVAAEGASDTDRQMILNHKAAIEFLVENAEQISFNRSTILSLHAILSENLLGNPADEGRLRTRAVEIGASVYIPLVIPQVIEENFNKILFKATAIPDPYEQSFFVLVHIPYLQPFVDVNKRTARLAANIPLIKKNLRPLSFVDVPERDYVDGTLLVYELQSVEMLRDVFVWAYERSCAQFNVLRAAMGDPDPIRLKYRSQLRAVVRESILSLIWPDANYLQRWSSQNDVAAPDQSRFASVALEALSTLHAEALGRYQIRPSEFNAWANAVASLRPSRSPLSV